MQKSAGAIYRNDSLQWAILERTREGWAFSDGGTIEGELPQAIQQVKATFRGLTPYIGLDLHASEIELRQGTEPQREIVNSIKLAAGDKRVVAIANVDLADTTTWKLAIHAGRDEVASVLAPWRRAGIDPIGLEPLEIAWLRVAAHHDAILDLREKIPTLIAFGTIQIAMTATTNVVTAIREARSQGAVVNTVLVLGEIPTNVSAEHEGITFTPFSVAHFENPPWADAFAIASAACGRELGRKVKATQKERAA